MKKLHTTAVGMTPGTFNSKSQALEPRITRDHLRQIEALYMDESRANYMHIKATAEGI